MKTNPIRDLKWLLAYQNFRQIRLRESKYSIKMFSLLAEVIP